MQAIYQWQMNQTLVPDLIEQFVEFNNMNKVDFEHFKNIITKAIDHTPELDALIKPHLDRDITALNPVELAILRLSAFEMQDCLDIPYRVVINEGVELAKGFGAQGSYKFINGVLDKMARQLRSGE